MSMLLLPSSINHSAPRSACPIFPSNKWCIQPYGPVQSLFCISKSINPQSVRQSTIRPLSLHAPIVQGTHGACNLRGLRNHYSAASSQSTFGTNAIIILQCQVNQSIQSVHQSTIQPLSLHVPFSQGTNGACNLTGLCNHYSSLASQSIPNQSINQPFGPKVCMHHFPEEQMVHATLRACAIIILH